MNNDREKQKEKQKQSAAKAAAAFIRDNMTLGIGTGSTVFYLIQEIGSLKAAGIHVRAVVTSRSSGELAASCGIPVLAPEEVDRIDLAIDGVDEIDGGFRAVKGGGGALLREKIVAYKADDVIWIMDESKLAGRLGQFPLPVEVLPFAYTWAAERIEKLGGNVRLREQNGELYYTDNGNYILDVTFASGTPYDSAAGKIRQIPGVLETGFFDPVCSRIIVGTDSGTRLLENPRRFAAMPECLPLTHGKRDGFMVNSDNHLENKLDDDLDSNLDDSLDSNLTDRLDSSPDSNSNRQLRKEDINQEVSK